MLEHWLRDSFSFHLFNDKISNLLGIIVIDKKSVYPAIGGTRFIKYSSLDAAIEDAVRLAKNMTLKCILSEIPFSGGKAVLLKPDNIDKEIYFSTYGEIIESFRGQFVTGCDSGTMPEDMRICHQKTKYITGLTENKGTDYLSFFTALGVLEAMKLALSYQGIPFIKAKILIQGVGKVGSKLAQLVKKEGASLTICDWDENLAKRLGEELDCYVVRSEDVYSLKCDIFSPCGLGGIFTTKTIPLLKSAIICGAANNQIYDQNFLILLEKRGILYIPDWICNIGGTIYAAHIYLKDDLGFIKNKVIKVINKRVEDFLALRSKKIKTFIKTYINQILEERKALVF